MKILLINKFFFLKGGAERVFFDTKNILQKKGHQVIEFAMKHPNNDPSEYGKFFVENVDLTTTKGILKAYKNLYSIKAKKKLEQLILQEKPDIAHLHNAYFQISPSIFSVLKKYKIPVVYTVHDYHLICPNYQLFTQNHICEKCKYHKYYNAIRFKCKDNNLIKSCIIAGVMSFNKIFQFYEKRVDYFITPSLFMKQKLLEWNFCSYKRIVNIPLSVDLKQFKTNTNVKDRKYFLYFGRFSHEKGIPILLNAIKNLENIPVKIMGDGPYKQYIQKLAKKQKNVEILPYQKQTSKIVEILSKAQAVIVPSIWFENYPMSILEAMSCQTPVIGSNIGGIPEMVINNKTGFTFVPHNSEELKQKILSIYNNFKLIKNLGENAREFVEKNNNSEIYYLRLLKIYEKAKALYI